MSTLPDNDATPSLIHELARVGTKQALYGTVVSAIAYGFVLAISGKCFKLLLQTKYIYSKRMQKFLFGYTIVMLLMSTGAMITEVLYSQNIFCPAIMNSIEGTTVGEVAQTFLSTDTPVFLPITVWGADGFMIWRCWILYNGISRLARVALFFILGILSIISLVGGLIYMLTPEITASAVLELESLKSKAPTPALGILFLKAPFRLLLEDGSFGLIGFTIMLTVVMNAVLAILIVARILYHQRHLRRVFGVGHGSSYTRVITICVESCLLITANGILFLALYGPNRQFKASLRSYIALGFPILTLPHVCVISPLLIIARVAQGRVATVERPSESEIQVASLRFNNVSGVVGETSATASR